MFCHHCGKQVSEVDVFCGYCGTGLRPIKQHVIGDAERVGRYAELPTERLSSQVKTTFLNATERVNAMVGEQGAMDINLRHVFSDIFVKHSKDEGELLFISGTKLTTPAEHEISTTWPKPWLFSRVFLVFLISYVFLYISTFVFQNDNAIPGLIIVGSFAAPLSLLVLFWEMNAPRNISIYETSKMFFIGGTASLVFTLLLYSVIPFYDTSYSGAIFIGVIEEIGKLAVVIYFIKKIDPKFILNGLLIGATIGAGFSAFESAGYAFRYGLSYGENEMLSVIFLRAWISLGTHVVWTAIAGGALVYVMAGERFKSDHLLDAKFLKLFAVAILLHAIWDMPLYPLQHFYFLYIVLIGSAWIFIYSLMNAGLQQIARIHVEY